MVTATTSLALRAVLNRAAAQASLEQLGSISAGLSPAAKAFAAVCACRAANGLVLLVVPTDKDVEQVTADARFFYAVTEGASGAAVDQAVLPFPSLQADPYRGMTPHFRVAAVRGRALHA